jgi:hypothetical protein
MLGECGGRIWRDNVAGEWREKISRKTVGREGERKCRENEDRTTKLAC